MSPVALSVFGLLLFGLSSVNTYRLSRENQRLRRERDAHVLRYDSLLATKLHADRLLAEQRKAAAPQPAARQRAALSNRQLIQP